jgi:2-keto-3-deoxy-L-rhamnonate aldolase RhmA
MLRKNNRIITMLKEKQVPLGMQVFTGNPAMIEVLGLSGFDYIMLDTEHSPNNARDLEHMIRAADGVDLVTFVRVSTHEDESDIHRALEAGAMGIFLPLIKSAADVSRAGDAAYFPGKGRRGICPSVRAAQYNWADFGEYVAWNNDQVLLIPMIERVEALEDIEAICALEDVKIIVFAAGDLAFDMGLGASFMSSPEIQDAYRKVLDTAKRHDVAVMGGPMWDPTPDNCRKSLDQGVTIFCLGLDTMYFRKICESTVDGLNAGVIGSGFTRPPKPRSAFK